MTQLSQFSREEEEEVVINPKPLNQRRVKNDFLQVYRGNHLYKLIEKMSINIPVPLFSRASLKLKLKNQEPFPEITKELVFEIVELYQVYSFKNLMKNGKLSVVINNRKKSSAGSMSKTHILTINKKVFDTLTVETKIIKGCGLILGDKLEALMATIEHELVHHFIFLFPLSKKETAHGKTFKKITKKMFGHAAISHCYSLTLGTLTKKDLSVRDNVSFIHNGKETTTTIVKVNKTRVVVMLGNKKLSVVISILNKVE